MNISCFFIAVSLLLLSSTEQSFGKTFFNSTTDQHALLAFKNTITSDPHGVLSKNWSTNTSICYWIGVSCGVKHRRVTALNVSGFELGGTMAAHLGNLTFLRALDVSFNNFIGFIPSELSNLRRLKKINANFNNLTGEIPSWFGALSQLQHIHLKNNTFSGKIPLSLSNISKLQTLDMGYNLLDGGIPEEIGNFSSLKTVNLAGNQITGSMPNGMFNISSLIEINMRYNKLSGELPSDICGNANPKLKRIYLPGNQLYGEIPANICKCRELEDLRLAENHFNGSIPSEIGTLITLRHLSLWSNDFKGAIPNEIGILTTLIFIDLSLNNLAGSIPKQVGNLTSLVTLDLTDNNLTGELPQEFGNLQSLMYFSVGTNSLSGSIPYSIFNISTLKKLHLSYNEFSGSLPSNMGLSLFNLDQLLLHSNRLTGEIPSSITNSSTLTILAMNDNLLTGSIPNFGNLRLLQELWIRGNNLTGAKFATQELGFLSSLTNCQYLKILKISENPLNGILPTSIGNLSTSLQNFGASRCNIKGAIPSEIGNIGSLLSVYLDGNQMEGVIPTTIGKLKQIQRLHLGSNQLQGYIPNEICQMSNLGELDLSGNLLTSKIPECLEELKFLRNINLGSNKLNSAIPSNLWSLGDLLTLNLSSNNLSGQLSYEIGNLKVINTLDLSSNQFSSDIPSFIDGCESLEVLSLSNNKLGGSIPQSLGNVRGLTTLDLSNNNLSGLIPKSLEDLHFLQDFNVSYNRLHGEIPNGGSFVNFTVQSFAHNSALCGAIRFQVPICLKNHERSRLKNVAMLMEYISPLFISTIVLVLAIVMLIRRRKQRTMLQPVDISLCIAWRRISYVELLRGTNAFSEANLLGRGSFGSVYKATLLDGWNVAVKVYDLQLEGATKSFDTESKILSTIRHKNLVRVIGCCSNIEFKALILELIPNGSLEQWLYSDNYYLDLHHRLKIAIDVASALEYLHHGHAFPVVHCDIKPSNVLLDEDMTAHVCDFGIAKLFQQRDFAVQTKTLASIGYAAPEYGSEGKVSTHSDVYSYGIMLLEIFTRKKPTNDMFAEEMSLKEWVSEALQKNAIIEILDPNLLSRQDQRFSTKLECVLSIFKLAMKCLVISPEERINMVEAGVVLCKIKARVLAVPCNY